MKMNKFSNNYLDHAGFLSIEDQLTVALALAFQSKLVEMGEEAKSISWFSSVAKQRAISAMPRAA